MALYRIDLHIHSILSPCADLFISPSAILKRAISIGLDIIAITDHNMAENGKALAEKIRESDLSLRCFYGLEVQTEEEVHLLCLFEYIETAMLMQDYIYPLLPDVKNDPERFGYQVVVDKDDNIIRQEENLLINSVMLTCSDIFNKVVDLDGIVIPAHIDKPVYSIISQLGFIPDDIPFPTLEVSRNADIDKMREVYSDFNLVSFSDSHWLDAMGSVYTEIELEDKSFRAFKKAVLKKQEKPFKIVRTKR